MATVRTSRQPVKATRPVTGFCRWLTKPNSEHGYGVLSINGTAYEVMPLFDGEALVGYRLVKADGTMYDISTAGPDGSTCDCPDATYHPERPGGCKHIKALAAVSTSARK
jgi:hypothetical protein